MIAEIGESVKVGVVFDEVKKIIPKWFIWNGRKHTIERVTFTWKVQEGRNMLHRFAVTDGANLYELCYDTAQLSWRLMNISTLG
jgi:hypothetical protein